VLQMEYQEKDRHPVIRVISKILHMKKEAVYYDEMLLIGLVTSMVIHAIYDFILSVNFGTYGYWIQIITILLYFFGGFWYLTNLLSKKKLSINMENE